MPGPDHLRALAITLVFLFHYRIFAHPAWVDAVGSFGWTGVDLFFVLSGYLIAGQLFRQAKETGTTDLRAFFLKRFFRIMPAYLVVVSIYFCCPVFHEREALPPLWKFLTFTQNFGLDLRSNGTFSHAWSLCVEEQFYLLLPLVMAVLMLTRTSRLAPLMLAFVFIGGLLLRLYSWRHFLQPVAGNDDFVIMWYKWLYYPTYNRLDGLLAGIAIAGVCTFCTGVAATFKKHGRLLLCAGLLLIACAYYICREPQSFVASVYGFPVVALAYGCILFAALSPGNLLSARSYGITSVLAKLPFALYLCHKGVIHITQLQAARLGLDVAGTPMFLLCAVTCIVAALTLHYAVERPFMALRGRILMQKHPRGR